MGSRPPTSLTQDVVPSAFDVLSLQNRNTSYRGHEGNKLFRDLIRALAVTYHRQQKSASKRQMVEQMVEKMRDQCGIRFLAIRQGKWQEISHAKVHEKISAAFRNAARTEEGGLQNTDEVAPLHTLASKSACCDHEWFSLMVKMLTVFDSNAIRKEVPPIVLHGGVGRLPLHVACVQPGCQDANLKTLLDLHKPALGIQDGNGCTPLALAIQNNVSAESLYVLVRESPQHALQTIRQL